MISAAQVVVLFLVSDISDSLKKPNTAFNGLSAEMLFYGLVELKTLIIALCLPSLFPLSLVPSLAKDL